jgi:hypothetical protein
VGTAAVVLALLVDDSATEDASVATAGSQQPCVFEPARIDASTAIALPLRRRRRGPRTTERMAVHSQARGGMPSHHSNVNVQASEPVALAQTLPRKYLASPHIAAATSK